MKRLPLVLLLSFAAGPLCAQHAHEHGVARLGLVLSGAELGIEWSSPLDTIVGFEHAPGNAEQESALAAATERLRDPAAVVSLPPSAGCQLVAANVAMPFDAHDAAEHRDGDHDHEHEHEHEHEAKHEEAHGQDPGHDAEAMHGEHADLVVTYSFDCKHPEALRQIEVTAFGTYPRLQRVEAAVLTDSKQGAARLTRDDSTWVLPAP